MHPQSAITICGFFSFILLNWPSLPYTRKFAFSRTVHVLYTTISASSESVGVYPISSRIPRSFSESLAFIWQPNVCVQQRRGLLSSFFNCATCSLHFSIKYSCLSSAFSGIALFMLILLIYCFPLSYPFPVLDCTLTYKIVSRNMLSRNTLISDKF